MNNLAGQESDPMFVSATIRRVTFQSMIIVLGRVYEQLASLVDTQEQRKADELREDHWARVCYRLDVVALVSFTMINVLLFYSYAGSQLLGHA